MSTPQRPHTLVVGGTRGIGRAVVNRFASQRHDVSVIGRNVPSERPRRGVNHWSVDVADRKKLRSVLAQIIAQRGELTNLIFVQRFRGDGDAWQGELDISLNATHAIIEAARDRFRTGGGSVVITCSNASRLVATEQPVAYHAAKAALRQMVRWYAVALGPRLVRVNAVSPGTVLKAESREFYQNDARLMRLYSLITPLRRMGTAEELAGVMSFLCSEQASFITGQDIVVDGGLSLLWQESLARLVASAGVSVKPRIP